MAMKTDQIKLPVSVATEIVNKAKDTSTIASLSPSTPQIFSDADYLVFNGKSEAEVVAEGAVKSSYEQTVDSVVAKRFKVQTTTRVTSELQWADEDNQLQIIRSNGVALSKTWASRLRKLRVPSTGMRFYPEIPLNLQAGSLDGITAATSGTVNGRLAKTPTKVLAFMGDFSLIKWGMVRDLTSEIIAYGDPDQTGVDLKAHNQIAYRTEAMYAFAIIDPKAFAVLKATE